MNRRDSFNFCKRRIIFYLVAMITHILEWTCRLVQLNVVLFIDFIEYSEALAGNVNQTSTLTFTNIFSYINENIVERVTGSYHH